MEYPIELISPTPSKFFHCHTTEYTGKGHPICQPHTHTWIEILYCTDGEMTALVGGREYFYQKGDLLVVPAGDLHKIVTETENRHAYTVIKFSPEVISTSMYLLSEYETVLPFLIPGTENRCLFHKKEIPNDVIRCIQSIMQEYQAMEYGYEIALKSHLYTLILWLIRKWGMQGTTKTHQFCPSQFRLLQSVFDYVSEHYANDISIEQLAKMHFISYSHFSSLFKKMTGQNFTDYLNSVRIAAAEKLLVTTDMQITEIAFAVGYSDPSYFARRFSEQNHIAPRAYRLKYREEH